MVLRPEARTCGPDFGSLRGDLRQTRAFGKRFFERIKGMPTMNQAATCSATLHYLKAVQAAGTKESKPVMAKMRELPVRDAFTDNAGCARTAAWCTACSCSR
jgi:Periplasmic binding protein